MVPLDKVTNNPWKWFRRFIKINNLTYVYVTVVISIIIVLQQIFIFFISVRTQVEGRCADVTSDYGKREGGRYNKAKKKLTAEGSRKVV